jgi:hypothetical protein
MSEMVKVSNALVPSRMKTISISRSIFPLFLTVAFMACLVNFSISDGLSSLEQNNPVLLALGNFHHDHHGGRITTSITTSTSNVSNRGPVAQVLYPEEDPIPNPELADGHDTFSACMLVMDDNHRLVEWLVSTYIDIVLLCCLSC